MIPSKFEPVYNFRTDKDHRRLCLSEFSYLQYWQSRNDARDKRLEKDLRDQIQLIEMELSDTHAKAVLPTLIVVQSAVLIVAILAILVCWIVS